MNVYENKNFFEILAGNTYPGRGIMIGKSEDGKKAVFAYFIMGRSANSRNRIFNIEGDDVVIYPFDASKVEDPSLIIYSPIRVFGKKTIVTNGNQTDTIYDFLNDGKSFEEALETRCFEPDAPNYTPRISGIIDIENGLSYKLSILKSADSEGSACDRYTFSYSGINGVAHFISTYNQDGNPIPTFTGEPRRVELKGDIDELANNIWESLNEANKISLYVRTIDIETGEYEARLFNKNN